MQIPSSSSAWKPSAPVAILGLLFWLVLTFCAPALGIFGMPGDWYASLRKPSWNPPAWIFGPVWSLLYTLMAVAAWWVWRQGGWRTQRGPLTFYLIQLLLNAAWSPLFFGFHRPGLALIDIVLMDIAILVTMRAFFKVRKTAGFLLVPYQLWVAFATLLNLTLWWMNRG